MSEQVPIMPGSVVITPTKMYEEMQAIARKVDHVATILDPTLEQLRTGIDANRDRLVKVDGRVTALEHWRWFVLGVAAIVGPAAGIFGTMLYGG
jgi:hypothetical protein